MNLFAAYAMWQSTFPVQHERCAFKRWCKDGVSWLALEAHSAFYGLK